MASRNASQPQQKVYYVMGMYYPNARPHREISADEAYRHIPAEHMDKMNKRMVGMPITTNHPMNDQGALPSSQYRTSERGKCVWSGKIRDGYCFVGEMRMHRGAGALKSSLTHNAIRKGEMRGVSLGNSAHMIFGASEDAPFYAVYEPDHIALLSSGKQEHRPCEVFECTEPMSPLVPEVSLDDPNRCYAVSDAMSRIILENSTEGTQLSVADALGTKRAQTSNPVSDLHRATMSQQQQQVPAATNQPGVPQNYESQGNGGGQQQAAMTDDSQQRQQQQPQNDNANNDITQWPREKLMQALAKVSEQNRYLQQNSDSMLKSTVNERKQQLNETLEQLKEQLSRTHTAPLSDEELTDERRQQIDKEVNDFLKSHFTPKDTKDKTAYAQDLAEKLRMAKGLGNQFKTMMVASAVGAQRTREAVNMARRNNAGARHPGSIAQATYENNMRGGVRAQPMKSMHGEGQSTGTSSWTQQHSSQAPSVPPSSSWTPQSQQQQSAAQTGATGFELGGSYTCNDIIKQLEQSHNFKPRELSDDELGRITQEAQQAIQTQRLAKSGSSYTPTFQL